MANCPGCNDTKVCPGCDPEAPSCATGGILAKDCSMCSSTARCNECAPDDLPKYSDPGRALIHCMGFNPESIYPYDVEVMDYDDDASTRWLADGIGIEHFVNDIMDTTALEPPAFIPPNEIDVYFVIEDITGVYYLGEWGFTDDDEDWYHGAVRFATPEEIESGSLGKIVVAQTSVSA